MVSSSSIYHRCTSQVIMWGTRVLWVQWLPKGGIFWGWGDGHLSRMAQTTKVNTENIIPSRLHHLTIPLYFCRVYPETSIYDGCMTILLANGTVVSQNAILFSECGNYQVLLFSAVICSFLRARKFRKTIFYGIN